MSTRILFQGDSITDALRSRDNDQFSGNGYPTLIKAELGYAQPGAYTFLNRGVSGNRVVDLYARIKADLINLAPDVLSVLIGINDVWHEVESRNGVDAARFERVYDMLLEDVRQALPGIRLMILEPFVLPGLATCSDDDHPGRWAYFQAETPLRAAAARRVAEKHGAVFVPLQQRFDQACRLAAPDYWLFDGVHPTAMGHALIARAWLEAFRKS